jgi:tetratricopeptide (TPR) repeat protein/AraC-like DNA-binding protein
MKVIKPALFILLAVLTLRALPAVTAMGDTAALFARLKSMDRVERLKALEAIAKQYFRINKALSVAYAKEELTLASEVRNREYQVKAFLRLGIIYSAIPAFDSARYYLTRAADEAAGSGDRRSLSTAYAFLGHLYFSAEDRVTALKYYKQAAAADPGASLWLIDVYTKMGIIYGDAGNITLSMDCFNRSLKASKEQNDYDETGYIYSNIAGIFTRIGSLDKSIEYNGKALELFTRLKNPAGEAYILNNLGMTYFQLGRYRQALACYEQALGKRDPGTEYQAIAFTLTNMGDVLLQLQKPDSARRLYERSLEFSEKSHDQLSRCCTYLSLGKLNLAQKDFSKALSCINLSLQLSNELGYRVYLEDIYALLSEVYNALGHHEESLACLKKRNALKDSALHVQARRFVTEMMIKYETGEKKEEISRLSLEADKNNARLRNTLIILFGLFLVIAVSAGFIYYYYRKNLKPKVRSLDLIRNRFLELNGNDSRRMKLIKKILPGEFDLPGDGAASAHEAPSALIAGLEVLMSRDKVFLNESLTLGDVSGMLKTNTAYLSRQINDHYGQNFNTFVNKYRIEEAKELMKNNRHVKLSYEGIARSVGFRSRSSFNQAFKAFTGMTPGEYAASFRS